jgi:hypothetical protein
MREQMAFPFNRLFACSAAIPASALHFVRAIDPRNNVLDTLASEFVFRTGRIA